MEILGILFFWFVIIVAFLSIPFGFAGTFVIVADVLVYALIHHFVPFTWLFLVILLSIAILVEIIESLLGALMAKQFGGSKWSMLGALVGGILGAIWATPLLPLVGTVIGGFLGAFLGAVLVEYLFNKNWHNAFKAGTGALLGSIGAKGLKIVAALIMILMIIIRLKQG